MQPTRREKDALIALFRAGRHADANAAARRMAKRYPRSLDAWNIRGASARELGQLHEAEVSFRELARLAPDFAGAPYNLALVLENRGADEEAAAAYARSLALDPGLAQAHNNLGTVRLRLGDIEAALAHLERAAALQPGWPEVHNSHGNALKAAHRFDEARAAYRRAIDARPGFARAHYNLGALESEFGDRTAAIAALRAALAVDPDHALALALLLHLLAQRCEWEAMREHEGAIARLGIAGEAVPPFILLALEDNAERQLQRARRWASARFGRIRPDSPPPARPRARPKRLRIGYFSADFYEHPMMQLLSGPMRAHDRERFEVHAFSHAIPRDDEGRRRAIALADRFHDVFRRSDAEIARLMREQRIDIAVDMNGYTRHSRSGLFARRVAGVQINFLGFPGSMGAPFIDYIIADATVLPPDSRAICDERRISLPHTYFPTDDAIVPAASAGTRADHGLPEDAIVFCQFNAPYKVSAREFGIWMRVLNAVPNSVLWMLRLRGEAQIQLRAQAAAHGVEPDRLIFAERVPLEEHLARHAHADLFLDSFRYTAHTTALDALTAGLPVITKAGEQFSARTAASLLVAARLPELITTSEQEYEALILDLSCDAGKLRAIREKLAKERRCAPLFDTALYTRHLEAGYEAAFERFRKGLPPADIAVADQTGGAPRP